MIKDKLKQSRIISAELKHKRKDIQLINIYTPNGNPVDTDKYTYKKEWLDTLIKQLMSQNSRYKKMSLKKTKIIKQPAKSDPIGSSFFSFQNLSLALESQSTPREPNVEPPGSPFGPFRQRFRTQLRIISNSYPIVF